MEHRAKGAGAEGAAKRQHWELADHRRKECTAQTTRIFQSEHLARCDPAVSCRHPPSPPQYSGPHSGKSSPHPIPAAPLWPREGAQTRRVGPKPGGAGYIPTSPQSLSPLLTGGETGWHHTQGCPATLLLHTLHPYLGRAWRRSASLLHNPTAISSSPSRERPNKTPNLTSHWSLLLAQGTPRTSQDNHLPLPRFGASSLF